MANFWDDLLDDHDEDVTAEMPTFLRAVASMVPEYQEMKKYLRRGMEHMVELYGGDILNEEAKLKTEEGTSHCAIIDAAMIETLDDELMTQFVIAVKLFHHTENPEKLFEELKSLVHYQVHIGMCIGIGMALEDGTLRSE